MDSIAKLQYEDISEDAKKDAFHEFWITKIQKANPKIKKVQQKKTLL